jgi:hypothetical protein
MAMRRRLFLHYLLGGAAALAVPVLWAGRRVLPQRVTEALRGRVYPGHVASVKAKSVHGPAKWSG